MKAKVLNTKKRGVAVCHKLQSVVRVVPAIPAERPPLSAGQVQTFLFGKLGKQTEKKLLIDGSPRTCWPDGPGWYCIRETDC